LEPQLEKLLLVCQVNNKYNPLNAYEGLAPVIVDEIEKTLNVIKEQGITTITVEQNAVRALELADRSVILDTGSVVFDGTAKEVLDNAELRAEYLAI